MKGSSNMVPSNGQVKQSGKLSMGKTLPFWMKTVLILVGAQVLLSFLRLQFGGMLGWYLIPITTFPDAVTGLTSLENGFELVFRLDALEIVAAISLTFAQIVQFLLVNALILLLLAPLKMGVLERLWSCFRGQTENFPSLLRWYSKPSLLGKSVLVSLILDFGCRLLCLLCMLPSSLLYVYLYGGSWMAAGTGGSSLVALLGFVGMLLLFGGAALAFFCYSCLYPIAYCLAAQPDYPVGKMLRRGLDSVKGSRVRFFRFRLSFIIWFLLSALSYGVLDLYVLPYLSFSAFHFLQEAAKTRQANVQSSPELA